MFCYAVVPTLNHYAHGWEYPLLLAGTMRLSFTLGVLVVVAATHRSLFSFHSLQVAWRVVRWEWRLFVLAMLTTFDVVLFSLSYRFVDISVSVALTAIAPAASVVFLALLTWGRITLRQALGLAVSAAGVPLITWAGGSGIEASGHWWHIAMGTLLGLGVAVCNGLVVSSLRLGEALALEWFWEGLGKSEGMVWLGSLLTLAVAQGATAPLFLAMAIPSGLPTRNELLLMILMGLTVLLGTFFWSAGNGSGWKPAVNSLGYLQPVWALLILVAMGISEIVHWGALVAGMVLIIGANVGLQMWGQPKLTPPSQELSS